MGLARVNGRMAAGRPWENLTTSPLPPVFHWRVRTPGT